MLISAKLSSMMQMRLVGWIPLETVLLLVLPAFPVFFRKVSCISFISGFSSVWVLVTS